MWVNLNNCVLSFMIGDFLLQSPSIDGNDLPEDATADVPRYLVTATKPILELTPVSLIDDAYVLQNEQKLAVEEDNSLRNGGWWIDVDY